MNKNLFLLLLSLMLFPFCEKATNPVSEVEKYVQQLREGSYASMYLPDFGAEHIPDLLEYRESREIIHNYPVNPISSMYQSECSLGVFILWNIESIRLRAMDSEGVFAGFPSMNPIIKFRNPENNDHLVPDDAQDIVAEAYYTWWNSSSDFDIKKKIDPLASTPYSWW